MLGVRSYGDDPAAVASFVTAAAEGWTSSGIAPAAKHFPGHGDTHVDSHLSLPSINKSLSELEQNELVPFATAISANSIGGGDKTTTGIASIMMGHMALPSLTPNAPTTPASLSREISTDLLRTQMGFKGVVVTDCLEMDAVAELPNLGGVPGGAVQALKAGVDIVMVCHRFDRHVRSVEAVWKVDEKRV